MTEPRSPSVELQSLQPGQGQCVRLLSSHCEDAAGRTVQLTYTFIMKLYLKCREFLLHSDWWVCLNFGWF